MKILDRIRSLVSKSMDARASTYKPADAVPKSRPITKRDYSLRRAQNRRNTKGASAKKNVPGRSK